MPNKRLITELLLYTGLILFFLPLFYHGYDMSCWKYWTIYIHEHGMTHAYASGTDYPPLWLYALDFFGWIQGSSVKIAENINYLKVFPFLFDMLPVLLLVLMRKHFDLKQRTWLLLLLNIGYLYNSVIWGQVDSIHSNLALSAIILAMRFPVLSMSVFILALNMKIQTIVFIPVWGLCMLSNTRSLKKLVQCLGAALILQLLILSPFLISGTVDQVWTVVTNSFSRFPVLSMNAFNFWNLVTDSGTNLMETKDTLPFLFLSCKTAGLLLFFFFSFIVLLPLLIKTLKILVTKRLMKSYQELVFLSGGLVALVFFFFNTEMHERYSHPAMIFFFFYGIYSGRFGLYFLVSLAYLLNLERTLQFLPMAHHTFIFMMKPIAGLFLLIILLGILKLYRNYDLRNDILLLKRMINPGKFKIRIPNSKQS